ncbi:MAG: hypothetical protein A3F73_12740 [Gallionellales bacterium RIFCSPLOWO2_12_FULL_59_22]|nr:MAG: hypothetical protein A3F73_12740 [Gallionellales bacterium RIFCSPLOWO2_12_FULL_59_22]
MSGAARPDYDALGGTLSVIGAHLEQYLDAPGSNAAALETARGELRCLLDALHAARLHGTAAFCVELETVLGDLASHPDLFSVLHRNVLQHALSSLARHLGALANGADDAALNIFAEYRALQQLRGLETSFELDLFHPDFAVQLPQQVLRAAPESCAPARLKALRSQYQQGLLHWLRRNDAPGALQAMRHAVDGALHCLPQDGNRAFWWVAGGLLDCLRQEELPAEMNVGRLLGRIDRQMCAAVEGNAGEARPVMNEMLYLIGISHAAGDLAEEIRQAYTLDYYLPGLVAPPPAAAPQILDAMRVEQHAAEESWERCMQGNRATCEKFIWHAGQLATQSKGLGRHPLGYLAGQIHAHALLANGPEHARLIALDMAMAQLLLDRGLRQYAGLGSSFRKEAEILSGRMQAALQRQPEDARQLAELVRLHCRLERRDAMHHLFDELLANLQYLEEGLSAFFNDPAKRGELAGLLRLSGQLRGGLHVASLEQAERLLAAVQGSLRRFAQDGDVPETAESRALAEAVNALKTYLQRLAQDGTGSIALLQAAWSGVSGLRQIPDAAAAGAELSRTPAGAALPAREDQELLEVFLEEAQEVLHTLRNDLEACQLRPDNREPLVNIRRGFHTLKGSGRMVGLTGLGEVAWNVERALNKRLEDNRPATPELLRFIAGAEQQFTGWVDALGSQGGANIEAAALNAAARQIENGIEPEPQAEKPATVTPQAIDEQEAAPPRAPGGKPQARDDIDVQLLPLFLEEAGELCPKISAGLRAWCGQPDDERQRQLLQQLLHTLKGSARMAGAMRIGSMLHEMEERVLPAARAELREAIESDFDRIAASIEELRGAAAGRTEVGQAEYAGAERRKAPRTPDAGAERAMLRVRADLVERLAGEAAEIGMARSRMETEMRAFKEGLLELTGSVTRLRGQLREVEMQAESRMQAHAPLGGDSAEQFDPLEFDRFTRLQELTRFMNESVHDVQTVQQTLLKNFDATAAALAVQARLNRDLQQNLMKVRMVPFASIGDRLYRVVRQTAKELDKRANLELSGTGLELDRSMLERMTAPFEHLLRNALVHGIEDEQTRARQGKNPAGEIRLTLRHEGNEVVFELGDDGAGLDFEKLREKALAKGLLDAHEAAGEERLAQLVFVSGISTATEVTEVAGRGIGMDVVCGEVAALGGRIEVGSRQGQGARFTIRLPLTLAATHVLMVRSGAAIYGIPSTMVEQVRQVKAAQLGQLRRERRIEWQEHVYPLNYLPHLLGDTGREPEERKHNPILLLRSGDRRIALHVDGLLGNQEAVINNTGPQLAQLPVIAGATVQGNGTVVLILNPAQLALRAAAAAPAPGAVAAEKTPARPLVMVVDDSLTVRKVTTRLLARAGYRVATAKDGMDALEQLGGKLPDVMLLDIEMPRMDGFELTKRLRRDARTLHLPIIMITSRAADKHRDHALQLGVNAYLGKPYQEEELLQQIAGFAHIAEATGTAQS